MSTEIVRNLPEPARDLVRIRTQEEVADALDALPEIPVPILPRKGSACPFCPQEFGSLTELGTHIRSSHGVVSGTADLRPVELPDGTVVAAEDLQQEMAESQARVAELEQAATSTAKRKAK